MLIWGPWRLFILLLFLMFMLCGPACRYWSHYIQLWLINGNLRPLKAVHFLLLLLKLLLLLLMSSLWPCLLLLITLYLVVINDYQYEAAKGKLCQSILLPNAFARFPIVDQYDQYYDKPETRNSSHWACSVRHPKSLVWLAYNGKSCNALWELPFPHRL